MNEIARVIYKDDYRVRKTLELMNPFSIESWFGSNNINKRHNKRVMGKTWVAGKCTILRVGGPGEELS